MSDRNCDKIWSMVAPEPRPCCRWAVRFANVEHFARNFWRLVLDQSEFHVSWACMCHSVNLSSWYGGKIVDSAARSGTCPTSSEHVTASRFASLSHITAAEHTFTYLSTITTQKQVRKEHPVNSTSKTH